MRGTLIVFRPEQTELDFREFDRPLTLEDLQKAVGGYVEHVQGFDTIGYGGTVLDCAAFANEEGKLEHLALNRRATITWALALRRKGIDLYNKDGSTPKDWLVGPVAVVFGDREFMREL